MWIFKALQSLYKPVSDLYHQVGIIDNCWILSKFVICDDMLHKSLCKNKLKVKSLDQIKVMKTTRTGCFSIDVSYDASLFISWIKDD